MQTVFLWPVKIYDVIDFQYIILRKLKGNDEALCFSFHSFTLVVVFKFTAAIFFFVLTSFDVWPVSLRLIYVQCTLRSACREPDPKFFSGCCFGLRNYLLL